MQVKPHVFCYSVPLYHSSCVSVSYCTVQSNKYEWKFTNWCLEKSIFQSSSKWEYNASFFKSCLFQGEVMHGTDTNKVRASFLLMSWRCQKDNIFRAQLRLCRSRWEWRRTHHFSLFSCPVVFYHRNVNESSFQSPLGSHMLFMK